MIAWRTVSEMTCNVSSGTLNLTHSLTHGIWTGATSGNQMEAWNRCKRYAVLWLCQCHCSDDVSPATCSAVLIKSSARLSCWTADDRWFDVAHDSRMVSRVFNEIVDTKHSQPPPPPICRGRGGLERIPLGPEDHLPPQQWAALLLPPHNCTCSVLY